MESCVTKLPLPRPLIQSQRQPSSLAQEELGEKSILLRNAWRGTQLTLSRPRGGCISSRGISWHMGRRITVQVAEHWSEVAAHKVTLRSVEIVLKTSSGRRKREKPVFTLRLFELVMLPQDVR